MEMVFEPSDNALYKQVVTGAPAGAITGAVTVASDKTMES